MTIKSCQNTYLCVRVCMYVCMYSFKLILRICGILCSCFLKMYKLLYEFQNVSRYSCHESIYLSSVYVCMYVRIVS